MKWTNFLGRVPASANPSPSPVPDRAKWGPASTDRIRASRVIRVSLGRGPNPNPDRALVVRASLGPANLVLVPGPDRVSLVPANLVRARASPGIRVSSGPASLGPDRVSRVVRTSLGRAPGLVRASLGARASLDPESLGPVPDRVTQKKSRFGKV